MAIIPAYNEEQKIVKVISEVSNYVSKIVIVDDGSTDKTNSKAKRGKVVVLTHLVNLGQGAALQTGFEYAKKSGVDVVVTYDADGQFVASDIQKLVSAIAKGRAEVVFGSRFLGRSVNIPFLRLLVLKLGIYFTYLFSGIKLTDTHNGFRAFSRKALDTLNLKHNRWAHPSEVIYQITASGLKILEVPVTVKYTKYSRLKGQSSLEAIKIPFELVTKALFTK